MTLTRRDIEALLDSAGHHPSRALGQNFVADPNTVRRVARLAELSPGERVLEIGAGLGSLTMALAETGAKVVAVEADRRLVPLLEHQLEGSGVEVIHADATTFDFSPVFAGAPQSPWALVANLPYNLAVALVVRVLDEMPLVNRLLVMVQREVAERLAAAPGSKAYGAVSVKVAYHAQSRLVGRVPATVFVPRPRVESALVRIDRRGAVAVDPAVVGPERLFAVVRAGFAQRRKMLRRSLAGVVPAAAFERSGVDPSARAEQLSVEQWGRLAAWSD